MSPENTVLVTANKTLVDGDQGTIQVASTDGIVITLPAAAAGKTVVVRNGGAKINANGPVGATTNKSVGFTVRPAGADTLTGLGFTPAAAKGAVNTKATSQVGDELVLVAGAGTWYVQRSRGTFVREA